MLGISETSNTTSLFSTASALGVPYLTDDQCGSLNQPAVDEFLAGFADSCDRIHLTVDLDVLSAAAAPGVSAPAGFGIPVEAAQRICTQVATSGKLVLCDIAELNPRLDVDARTARTAVRLAQRVLTTRTPLMA